jgi:dephospho-CoA kinase
MIRVGLTGNRFSGKDTICERFAKMGTPIFDADLVLRFIINHNYILIDELRSELGGLYFTPDNRIDLVKLNIDRKINKLVKIVEPDIFRAYSFFEEKYAYSPYTIFSSSILYESQWYKKMDKNIIVYAPLFERTKRGQEVLKDRYYNRVTIDNMLRLETDELDKNKIGDYVIHNYNNFDYDKMVYNIDQFLIDIYIGNERETQVF